MGAYSCTRYAVPYILSGKWYECDTSFEEYMEDLYDKSPLIEELENRVFLDHLNAGGITVDDTENSFKFIHLEGAHSPYVYDAEVNIIDESQRTYAQNMEASVTLAERYLSALKKSGTYDNTAIIVMSDHGFNQDIDNADMGDNPFMRQCGLLLIKGVGEKHDTMQISEAPVSYEDLQEAYRRLLDGAWSDTVFDCREGDHRDRRYLWYAVTDEDYLVEYQQTGYASDLSTMIPTGREFRWTKQ